MCYVFLNMNKWFLNFDISGAYGSLCRVDWVCEWTKVHPYKIDQAYGFTSSSVGTEYIVTTDLSPLPIKLKAYHEVP